MPDHGVKGGKVRTPNASFARGGDGADEPCPIKESNFTRQDLEFLLGEIEIEICCEIFNLRINFCNQKL